MEGRLKLVLLLAAAAGALVVVVQLVSPQTTRTELTYWDGAAADEPGYQEEASDQIESGKFGYHQTGYWEAPGYWNNRGLAYGSESKMDARMMADASKSPYYQTGGTDFLDTNTLYNSADDDLDVMDNAYDNAWPGTGQDLYDYDNMDLDGDSYDGGFQFLPLDREAADDASVSGNDAGGFKAVGPMRTQQLDQVYAKAVPAFAWAVGEKSLDARAKALQLHQTLASRCQRCYSGSDCVAGCRSQVKSLKRRRETRRRSPKTLARKSTVVVQARYPQDAMSAEGSFFPGV